MGGKHIYRLRTPLTFGKRPRLVHGPPAGPTPRGLGCSGYWDVNAIMPSSAGAGSGLARTRHRPGHWQEGSRAPQQVSSLDMTRTLNAAATQWHGKVPRRCCSGEPSLPVCHRAPQAPSAAASTVRCPPFSSDARGLGDSSFKLLNPTQAPSVTDSEGRLNASALPASGSPKTRVAVKSV